MRKSLTLVVNLTLILSSVFAQDLYTHPPLRFGGYFQTWFILNQHEETVSDDLDTWGFRIRRARLSASADITDRILVASLIEFAGTQRHLLDFHVTANLSPTFQIRVGQYRPPAQLYYTSITSSAALMFYERPTIALRLSSIMGYDSFRDIGIMASGSSGPLWYGFYLGNGMGRFIQSGSNIISRDFGSGLYGGRVDINPTDGIWLGGHVAVNRQNNVIRDGVGPYDIDRLSFSFRFASDNIGLYGLFTQLELAAGRVADTSEFDFGGGYLELGYRLNSSWSLLSRYDYYTEEPAVGASRHERNLIVGFIYYWLYDNREIIRAGANFGMGTSDPGSLERRIFVLWFQVRF